MVRALRLPPQPVHGGSPSRLPASVGSPTWRVAPLTATSIGRRPTPPPKPAHELRFHRSLPVRKTTTAKNYRCQAARRNFLRRDIDAAAGELRAPSRGSGCARRAAGRRPRPRTAETTSRDAGPLKKPRARSQTRARAPVSPPAELEQGDLAPRLAHEEVEVLVVEPAALGRRVVRDPRISFSMAVNDWTTAASSSVTES